MTSFNPPSWIRHLGYYFFHKKSKNNGNWYKIKPECKLAQTGEFLEFDEKNWQKNYRIMSKKLFFAKIYMKLAVAMETSKMMDTLLTYQNICEGWMNSYWKFQPLLKKPYWEDGIPPPRFPTPTLPPCTPEGWGILKIVLHSLSFHYPK